MMRTRTAAVLGAAMALGGGAYAVGTQVEDGSAAAATSKKSQQQGQGPQRPGLSSIAAKLGVSESDLQAALDAVKPDRPKGDPGQKMAEELATELGLDATKVKAALDKLAKQHQAEHKARHDAFVKALAAKLGVSEDKVSAAFPEPGPGGPGGPGRPGRPGGPPPAGAPHQP